MSFVFIILLEQKKERKKRKKDNIFMYIEDTVKPIYISKIIEL